MIVLAPCLPVPAISDCISIINLASLMKFDLCFPNFVEILLIIIFIYIYIYLFIFCEMIWVCHFLILFNFVFRSVGRPQLHPCRLPRIRPSWRPWREGMSSENLRPSPRTRTRLARWFWRLFRISETFWSPLEMRAEISPCSHLIVSPMSLIHPFLLLGLLLDLPLQCTS